MRIQTEQQLEDILSQPSAADIESLARVDGDILILGVAGKMGPGLARRAARASRGSRRIIGVARFSEPALRKHLEYSGVETIASDLLYPGAIGDLPHAPNVIYMAARKFGTSGAEPFTWATNAYLPGLVAERYRSSRIVAWSSGNIYPFSSVSSRGCAENSAPGPVGEYAQSVLARERVFQYFSESSGTKLALLRLNYAVELRYGVLADIGLQVFHRQPVDLRMGFVNLIWQGDVNSICLRSLEHCSTPPFVLNLTSAEAYSVRSIAGRFSELFEVQAEFKGVESDQALLSDASLCREMFGEPSVGIAQAIQAVGCWIQHGGTAWNKPTHFEVKDGSY